MLKLSFNKLINTQSPIKSFDLILQQAKSNRFIKNYTSHILERYDLSALDWSLLGSLFKEPEGCRFVDISKSMGVEPPFVTELINDPKFKSYIEIKTNPEDRRAKIVALTSKGKQRVVDIEKRIHTSLSKVLSTIPGAEMRTYVSVMGRLIDNLEHAH
ncbi:MAG: hypothetical protein O3B87_04110 [bacterium]|nr:hypothetical protein [bacterium]